MTQFQESAATRKLVTSERAFTAPFLAITAGLVVLLMALAVMSFVLAGRPADVPIQANTDTAAVDGYMAGLTAANNQHRLDAAQQLNDGWAAALVSQRTSTATDGWEAALVAKRTSTATDGWEAALVQPHRPAVDGYIQRFLNDEVRTRSDQGAGQVAGASRCPARRAARAYPPAHMVLMG